MYASLTDFTVSNLLFGSRRSWYNHTLYSFSEQFPHKNLAWLFTIYQKHLDVFVGSFLPGSQQLLFHPPPPPLRNCYFAWDILFWHCCESQMPETVSYKWYKRSKWNTNFHLECPNQENGTSLSKKVMSHLCLACEHRRISGCHFSPPKNNYFSAERSGSQKYMYVCVRRLIYVPTGNFL